MTSGIGVVLLAAMAVHVYGARDELAGLRRLSLPLLISSSVLQLASQICLNASMLLPLQARVPGLGFWEIYLVRTGAFVVGAAVPVAGGLAVRLAYLRTRGLTYLDFTWATLFSNVLALGAAALLSASATGVLWTIAGRPSGPALAVAAGVTVAGVAAFAALRWLPTLSRLPRLGRWSWLSEMSGVTATRRMAASVFAFALLRHLFNFATFGVLYQALSPQPGGFLTGGLVYALTSPIRMVSITPANVGITEWFVALVGQSLAFDLTAGLLVALAFRAIGLLAQTLGALFGWAWLAVWNRA